MGHQSIFATNAAAFESKRDVIHSLCDIGGWPTPPHITFGVFEHAQSSTSASTALLNIHASFNMYRHVTYTKVHLR
jgi:hypothetical protein